MALKQYNPKTPGQRQLVLVDRSELYKGKPVKGLTDPRYLTRRAKAISLDRAGPRAEPGRPAGLALDALTGVDEQKTRLKSLLWTRFVHFDLKELKRSLHKFCS